MAEKPFFDNLKLSKINSLAHVISDLKMKDGRITEEGWSVANFLPLVAENFAKSGKLSVAKNRPKSDTVQCSLQYTVGQDVQKET